MNQIVGEPVPIHIEKHSGLDREELQLVKRQMIEAALRQAGETGFGGLTVAGICRASGASPSDFEALFSDVSECFAHGYVLAMQRFTSEVLVWGACSLEGALDRVADIIAADLIRSRALFLEGEVATGAVLRSRVRFQDEFAERLDELCRREAHPGAPPIAATFVVHVIVHMIGRAVQDDDAASFREEVPSLISLIRRVYGMSDGQRQVEEQLA